MTRMVQNKPKGPPPDAIIFEVKRDGAEVWLRPMRETDVVNVEEGAEFITGTLKVNPFKDGSKPMIDGNRRLMFKED